MYLISNMMADVPAIALLLLVQVIRNVMEDGTSWKHKASINFQIQEVQTP